VCKPNPMGMRPLGVWGRVDGDLGGNDESGCGGGGEKGEEQKVKEY